MFRFRNIEDRTLANMKIIIDAMGGDNAPGEIVRGAVEAAKNTEAEIFLVGNKAKIEQCMKNCDAPAKIVNIVHTDSVITMEDEPMSILRAKKDCSMAVGLRMLKEDGDAFISAGNTGALHAGSSLIIRPVKGVMRSGIATILPFYRPVLLMDCGANVTVTADYLEQWAIMGTLYMKNVMGISEPEVGLLNNGTEECKGTEIQREAYALLKSCPDINFIGNVESKDIPRGVCDVLVTDGFTGNIALKLTEGMAKFLFGMLKDVFGSKLRGMFCYLLMKKDLKALKNRFDASAYGGAPILGISRPVIKAHGSSDARAIKNAIAQAEKFVCSGAAEQIADAVVAMRETVDSVK